MSGEELLNITVLTIGHSTRSFAVFQDLLKKNEVTLVADIRTVPKSRHYPQFNKDALKKQLGEAGIKYRHMSGLGGFRQPGNSFLNAGWQNASFRGFADYMQTKEFEEHLQMLINVAVVEQVALMCTEAVPWRCHRSLVADALLVRGLSVEHIINIGKRRLHALTPWARVDGTTIIYPLSGQYS